MIVDERKIVLAQRFYYIFAETCSSPSQLCGFPTIFHGDNNFFLPEY